MTHQNNQKCLKILKHYGVSPQLRKLAEECGEAVQAAYGELFRQKEQLQAEIACYRKSTNVDFVKLRNDLNDIFKSIREELGDDTVCGLCQFDGDFSCGESGYSITECPGFEKDDCFELKADFLEKYFKKGVKQ